MHLLSTRGETIGTQGDTGTALETRAKLEDTGLEVMPTCAWGAVAIGGGPIE